MTATPTSAMQDRKMSEALGLWEPKRTLTLEAARRHTQRIKFIRRLLLGFAALLCLAIIYEFVTQQGTTILEDNPEESVKMINPRYSGRTENGLPFYLTAASATRTLANRNTVDLVKPVLEFVRQEGLESSFVVASAGTYNDVDKVLNLEADVKLSTDDGYVCETGHARIFTVDNRIEGDQAINCEGNFGTVNGNAYTIEENYRVFIFKNGMDAIIRQDQDNSILDAAGEDEGLFSFGGNGPIDVTARRAIYRGNVTELEDDVKVIQDGSTITSDYMTITRRAEDLNAASGSLKLGAVQTITARENFRYKTSENDVRGNEGVYERKKNLITVSGDVKAMQPSGSHVDTDRLTYNVKSGVIRFSGDCQGQGCKRSGQSKIVLKGK